MGKKGNLSAFGSFDASAAKKAQQEIQSESAGDYFKFKNGKNRIRILPPTAGQSDPFRKVFTHYLKVKGENGMQTLAYTCPKRTKVRNEEGELVKSGRGCAVCDQMDELEATGVVADGQQAKQLRPQPRVYCNVIDRKDPTNSVKSCGLPMSVYKELVALREGDEEDEDEDGVDFTHPIEGCDIIVVREGEGMNTKYTGVRLAKQSPIFSDEDGEPDYELMEEAGESMGALDKHAALPTDKAMRMALMGKNPRNADFDDDDDDEPPRKRLSSGEKKKSRRAKKADVIEAEFDDDEDDDDDLPDGM